MIKYIFYIDVDLKIQYDQPVQDLEKVWLSYVLKNVSEQVV